MKTKSLLIAAGSLAAIALSAVAQSGRHEASGTIRAVDVAKGVITLQHGPVPSLNWPTMTMDFQLADRTLAERLRHEDIVRFAFTADAGRYVINALEITPAGGKPVGGATASTSPSTQTGGSPHDMGSMHRMGPMQGMDSMHAMMGHCMAMMHR